MKHIFLALFLLTATLLAKNTETDLRLNHYPKALKWLQDADTNGESAYNIGVLYHQEIKDNTKAIEWYEKACNMKDVGASADASINLGNIYKKSQQYDDAIFYYKKAYYNKELAGAHGLGLLYKNNLKNEKQGIDWYTKAAKYGYADSIKNLARYYKLEKNDNVLGGAYFLALIDLKYPKQKVIDYLKTKWNLSDEEIKKAYQLQKTLDIPKHYYDPEFEEKAVTKKPSRR